MKWFKTAINYSNPFLKNVYFKALLTFGDTWGIALIKLGTVDNKKWRGENG